MCGIMKRRTLLLGFGAGRLLRSNQTRTGPERLDRKNLLLYRDEHGSIRTVKKAGDWMKRRKEITAAMQEVMGPLPTGEKRLPLEVRIEEEVELESYVRRHITYAAEPGSRTPAYLLIPKAVLKGQSKARAVLCLHPTDHQNGVKVVVGLGGRANRQYAAELAERGYVALAPSYPLLADYQPDLKGLGYLSGTMKAVWDNIRGLDLLDSLPFVRHRAYGAIGHSLGGHNSVYTAVFDPRIRAVVSSCGLDSYIDYKDGDIRGWTSDRYMPRLLEYKDRLHDIPFDFPEMIAALAPRPCLISAPLKDDNFKWASVDKIASAAREVYRLYGKENNLTVMHPDCGHDFPDEIRQSAYKLFDREL
jgi:dienelactone hydrolase